MNDLKIDPEYFGKLMQGEALACCLYCGEETPIDPETQLPAVICQDCESRTQANNERIRRAAADKAIADKLQWFLDKIPDSYRETDEAQLSEEQRELLAGWDPLGRHGVTLCGPSQTRKTRTGVLLLRKAFLAGQKIEFHQAGDLRRQVNHLARDGKETRLLNPLAEVPILLIDDFGNNAFTDTTVEFFLSLFERRTNRRLPTIVTLQYPGEELKERMENQRAATAIARRIGSEFGWMLNTSSSMHRITRPRTL